ncbi:hypothetical protein, partial [Enterococcus casseliflavus]
LSRFLAFFSRHYSSKKLVPSVAPATTTAPSETVLLTQPEVIDRKKHQDQAEISCSFKAKIDKAFANCSKPD